MSFIRRAQGVHSGTAQWSHDAVLFLCICAVTLLSELNRHVFNSMSMTQASESKNLAIPYCISAALSAICYLAGAVHRTREEAARCLLIAFCFAALVRTMVVAKTGAVM